MHYQVVKTLKSAFVIEKCAPQFPVRDSRCDMHATAPSFGLGSSGIASSPLNHLAFDTLLRLLLKPTQLAR
eukprot:3529938-Amphidinium_carterae.1